MTKTLVFTDMDGTLLDHHTYSFEAAKPALTALEKRTFPLFPLPAKPLLNYNRCARVLV